MSYIRVPESVWDLVAPAAAAFDAAWRREIANCPWKADAAAAAVLS